MKVYAVQMNPIIGDLGKNTTKIIDYIKKGKEEGADLIVFPELSICGYPPEDLVFHRTFIDSMHQHLYQISKHTEGVTVLVGLVRRNLYHGEKALLNSAAVIQNKRVLGFQDKWLLPNYDVFNERRYFNPGTSTKVWDIAGKKVGIVICEDIWQHAGYVGYSHYERDPIIELVPHKPDLLVNLSASPYQFEKKDMRVQVCEKASKTLNCPVLLCCQVGANSQIVFDGYSVYTDKEGALTKLAKGFEEDTFLVDLEEKSKKEIFSIDAYHDLYQALTLGVRDYFKKCNFQKACIGLSGGIDSALVACIAKDALGSDNVIGVAMPSRYSSKGSVIDAKKLAKNLKISYQEISIEKPFKSMLGIMEAPFEGLPENIAEENLQARIRGMILMALSNKHGYIVLSTGNKSELALGYSTLYGDMCGGLGVIADVLKTQVYDLARWLNKDKEIIPNNTIIKPPSAELKPNQIDLDSLPDYGIIDNVLRGYVEDYLSAEEIAKKYSIKLEVVIGLIQRIQGAEYKRRQAPPMIRVSKKSFGIGRKYPIVQGWI